MATISKAIVDTELRSRIFDDILRGNPDGYLFDYQKINDRQYGTIIEDANGHERYVRIGVIVAEERKDVTARELMDAEIADYIQKQADKAAKAQARAEKAAKDKAAREAKAKEKEEEA